MPGLNWCFSGVFDCTDQLVHSVPYVLRNDRGTTETVSTQPLFSNLPAALVLSSLLLGNFVLLIYHDSLSEAHQLDPGVNTKAIFTLLLLYLVSLRLLWMAEMLSSYMKTRILCCLELAFR